MLDALVDLMSALSDKRVPSIAKGFPAGSHFLPDACC